MPLAFVRRARNRATIAALYGVIVAQARNPAFYADYGVPDTIGGRFDLLVLHLALVLRRLRSEGDPGREMGQGLFDAFCEDMDGNLRELGVSDLAMPKRMRGFGEAFYGRAAVYDRAFAQSDEVELAGALARNVFGEEQPGPGAHRLAAYARASERELPLINADAITAGALRFPDPASVPALVPAAG